MQTEWISKTSMSQRSRRRFVFDLICLGGGLLAAAVFAVKRARGSAPDEESQSKATSEPQPPTSFERFQTVRRANDLYSALGTFADLPVVDYDPAKPATPEVAYRFRTDWDNDNILSNLEHFIATPAAAETTALVIGAWHGDDSQKTSEDVVSALVSHSTKLPKLTALYIGDIGSEENEMSWIQQSDLSPLLAAFPNLEYLRSRGGEQLRFSAPRHAQLKALAIESGGLDKSVIQSLSNSDFPNLEYLELWLGTDDYGANITPADLQPILSGKRFPNLKYLGLRNSHIADEIAQTVVGSAIVSRIEQLDLSLGTLSDLGGTALLQLKSPTLKQLNLSHHYLSPGLVSQLQKLPFEVDAFNSSPMDADPEDRYVAVGE